MLPSDPWYPSAFAVGMLRKNDPRSGCVAMTVAVKPVDSISLSATAAVQVLNGTVYGMGEIMTTKEQVLATPRLESRL